jgi:hypothetical protein
LGAFGFGGLKTPRGGAFTTTCALAVLFAVFDSGSLATTVAVFVSVPAVVAVVTSVIVTVPPLRIVPSWQVISAPPAHVPCVVETDTKVVPAGSGSARLTPVAVSGPLL